MQIDLKTFEKLVEILEDHVLGEILRRSVPEEEILEKAEAERYYRRLPKPSKARSGP